MNSLARAIHIRVMAYPTISQNMWEILNHWFLTGGNGAHWIDGELRDTCFDRKLQAASEAFDRGERVKWKITNDNLMVWDREATPADWLISPLGKYGLAVTTPPDAKPEWKKAVIGLCRYIIKHNLNGGYESLGVIGENVKMAKIILEKLGVDGEEDKSQG